MNASRFNASAARVLRLTSSSVLAMIERMHYPGGKGKTYQHVINLMPPHRVYIETHLGGGAVMRHKRAATINIGVDVDERVMRHWRTPEAQASVPVQLHTGDAVGFLTDYVFEGGELLYLDPPYHPSTRQRSRVYRHDYLHDEHVALLALLQTLPCMAIISGYDSPLYRDMLAGWNRRVFNAKTHTVSREETLWFNFAPPAELHDGRYIGANFRDREASKRRLERLKSKILRMPPQEQAVISAWLADSRAATQSTEAWS